MITCLIVAFTAAILAGYAKGKINEQRRAWLKWRRFFQSGTIQRM